jgi:S-methylmethionine-dependent homocysteine/selenocysteine methylase
MSFVVPDDVVLVADGRLATELEARGNKQAQFDLKCFKLPILRVWTRTG